MRVQLKEFQADAVYSLLTTLDNMRDMYVRNGMHSAVSLTAPTGSGKTVMLAAAIESLFFGNADTGQLGDDKACVLWLSDSPSLNDQTRARFVNVADKLADWMSDERHLETVENNFGASHEALEPKHVYFMSKDLLGKGKLLTKGSEDNIGRIFWDIVDRTIKDPERHLYLFIDEAHRGLGMNASSEGSTATIYANLIDGFEGRAPMPVVVGISATPQRFEGAMQQRKERILMPAVEVTPKQVQESGLLKDTIELRIPEEDDPVEHQYLDMACERFAQADALWRSYCKAEGETQIEPLMIVQVKDKINDEALKLLCDQIAGKLSGLNPATSFGNVFGEHSDIAPGGKYIIRYVEPELVQQEKFIRVLFAKEAISNGWDCPRAEVIFSQRRRSDATYIAQLVGRMVRTPLARRIDADDVLNSVACYLPQFNPDSTQAVVDYLTGKGDDIGGSYVENVILDPIIVEPAAPRDEKDYEAEAKALTEAQAAQTKTENTPGQIFDTMPNPPIEVTEASVPTSNQSLTNGATPTQPEAPSTQKKPAPKPAPLTKRDESFSKDEWAGIKAAFDTLLVRRLPKKARNEFKSLLDTATLLMDTGVDPEAGTDVNEGFVNRLIAEMIANKKEYEEARRKVEVAEMQIITIDKRNNNDISTRSEAPKADAAGIKEASKEAWRVFGGDELVNAYRRMQIIENKVPSSEVDLQLAAASRTASVVDTLVSWAANKRADYFDAHAVDRDYMSEENRQKYDQLEGETSGKRVKHVEWPTGGSVVSAKWPAFPKHIVQDKNGMCHLDVSPFEEYVARKELARPYTVAFYRNPSNNSPQVFSIPYTMPNGRVSLRPDFIFFTRDDSGKIRPAIVDPHGAHLGDSLPKLKGYVEFLRDFPDMFAQVLSVTDLAGTKECRFLNLLDGATQDAIMNFSGDSAVELYMGDRSHTYGIKEDIYYTAQRI